MATSSTTLSTTSSALLATSSTTLSTTSSALLATSSTTLSTTSSALLATSSTTLSTTSSAFLAACSATSSAVLAKFPGLPFGLPLGLPFGLPFGFILLKAFPAKFCKRSISTSIISSFPKSSNRLKLSDPALYSVKLLTGFIKEVAFLFSIKPELELTK